MGQTTSLARTSSMTERSWGVSRPSSLRTWPTWPSRWLSACAIAKRTPNQPPDRAHLAPIETALWGEKGRRKMFGIIKKTTRVNTDSTSEGTVLELRPPPVDDFDALSRKPSGSVAVCDFHGSVMRMVKLPSGGCMNVDACDIEYLES